MEKVNPVKHNLDFAFEDSLPLDDEGAELLRCAKTGDLQAIRNLGCAYIWGENGYSKDEERARNWYIIAAKFGHEQAMWDVATMLISGEGGPVDMEKGLLYLKKLANKKRFTVYGTSACEYLIDTFEGKLGNKVRKDEQQVHYWKKRLKEQKRYYRGWKRKCR